jgi:hypothetical protein
LDWIGDSNTDGDDGGGVDDRAPLNGTGLESIQKEKEWSGWDLNSTILFP